MLKWTGIVVGALVLLVGIVVVIGWMMPKGHRASRTIYLSTAPAAVFAVISDVAREAEWRRDLTKVEMLPPVDGKIMFREVGRQGPLTMCIETIEPPRRMVTRIADKSLPFGGTWTFDIAPRGSGSGLTITEDGEVYNPIFRFISKTFMSPTGTIDAYLEALKKKLGES